MRTGEEFRDDVRRKGLPPAVVKALTRIDPLKSTYAVVETFAVIAAAVAAAIYWWNPVTVACALLLIATRQQALFVLAHDAAHYRMYENRRLNDTVGRLCGTLAGISMCTYRVVHRLHHNHLYEARDPDTPLHGGYPRGSTYLAKKLAKDLLGFTAWKTYAYFFGAPAINDDADAANRPLDDTSPGLRRAARRDRWVVVGFHLAAPAAAFAAGFGVEYLLLWVLPLVTLLQPLLRLRAICEHGAVSSTTVPELSARTNLGPKWLMWLCFPHHVHYHIEHHLYPSIPHYNLPACHEALVAHGILDGAEVRRVDETMRLVFAAPRTAAV
jgi:fatty acid desaturase